MTIRVAHRVHKDEPAACLVEVNRMAPDPKSKAVELRRHQIITVNRDGELAEFVTDLGPADHFDAQEFQIVGLWEHSVAELIEIADNERWKDDYWLRFLREKAAESTLIPDFLNQFEELQRIKDNKTQVGPYLTKQRNGFSRKGMAAWSRKN